MKLFQKKKKIAVVCIHGFGVRGPKEFANIEPALKQAGYDVFIPRLFDLNNPNDIEWGNWIFNAEKCINQIQSEYEQIVLIGFSMGGIIASYLANKAKVSKLILLAAAYDYLNIDNVIDYIFKRNKNSTIPTSFKNCFKELVDNTKTSIERIQVPTLLLHCAEDEVININSSFKLIKKIPIEDKLLITFSQGQHRMLDDIQCKDYVIQNILYFIQRP
ncbi:MAG: alpha/beta fold hydrolase [Erysipelotrichaceae bacterium]|nr:alpha/beta fold hydrolase [Erysipelotrichaceae bacterium]